ncbi:2,3-bisphosphoglycerate-independent phosphoglycerate mutase [bacterium]|nr:MAG: 2,3-bisphosphoglycerate-independent phosphoglycerate mutase [bacterium]
MKKKVPTVLMVLDGWGLPTRTDTDAISAARTPSMERLMRSCPSTTLSASGEDVGLPDGQIGNSEVGHLNLGAGRIVYQDFTRINKAIESGEFQKNPVFLEAIDRIKEASGNLHVMGLLSDGGVHSHIDQIKAFISMASIGGIKNIFVHAFMDGRDTPPNSGIDYMKEMEAHPAVLGNARIAMVSGRYYAMDRDNRWDRVEKAYRAMVQGEGRKTPSGTRAVEEAYRQGETDEFIVPTVISDTSGPVGMISDGDGIVFMNFRGDRAREITQALTDEDFSGFNREKIVRLSTYVCLTEYDDDFAHPVAFPPIQMTGILGEVLSERGLTQLRIAETEKYAHVTFFFNGGEEHSFPGEDRCLIPSPQDVPTYDLKPQMSANEVTDELLRRLDSGRYDFILINYANPDMVGHTGIFEAAVKAIEKVDECVGRVADRIRDLGGRMIITADHGNAESMLDANGIAHTAHTTGPVPLILLESDFNPESPVLRKGTLADVAPTILKLMNIQQPPEMTGSPLF